MAIRSLSLRREGESFFLILCGSVGLFVVGFAVIAYENQTNIEMLICRHF